MREETRMRFGTGLAAVLLLAGCAPIGPGDPAAKGGPSASLVDRTNDGGPAMVGADFDYNYAFRLPAARIAQVQDGHVRACDQLGRTRCRVMTVRYRVEDNNTVSAVLAFQIDPAIARNFGREASNFVKTSGGLVIDARMAGLDGPNASGRASNVVGRLREQIATIDNQLRGTLTDSQREVATEKQGRLRAAIAMIGELDQAAIETVATTPILFTYQSGTIIPSLGGSSTATFDNAGQLFVQSAAAMAQVLAGVGPWLLLLIGGALILRRFVQPEEPEAAHPIGVPLPTDDENRNVIQRWFSREPAHQHESEPAS